MKGLRLLMLVLLLGGIAASAALLWQRTRGGEALVVKKVLIDVEPAAVAAGIDREAVRRIADEVLAGSRGVVVDPAVDAVLRVRIESFVVSTPPAIPDHPPVAPSSSLSLAMDIVDNGQTLGRGHAVAAAQGLMAPDALIGQGLRDALRQIQQARTADTLDSDTLLAWLSDPETSESQRRRAMQALASRGERRATPALVEVLRGGDEDDATAALQALALLGDPAAIDAVIDFSSRQPALVRKLCIDAVRATASPRAIPWLFTLSSGHPDADVQAHARAALAGLAPDLQAQGG